ncbi:hypothetical protein KY285_029949 [Solanum tuberosum]|nr:hypothetical protein KY285_029949 [Solanum tuberosum]
MRPTGSIDKGKGVASSSDTYSQTLLSNMRFRPQTTSIEMMDRMYFGFNDFTEALDYARGILGPNYYISPALRQNPQTTPQYNIQKDTDKIIFCDHCSSMTEAFKRLNAKVEALLQENAKLMEQVKSFKGKDSIQKNHTSTQTSEPRFSSQNKMDEQGVHSPTNAKRSTVSDNKDTASPVQTVAGKDTSNPFMAVTLPKSEDEGSSSRQRLPRSFTQDKHVITTQNPNPSGDRLVPDTKRINTERDRTNTSSRRDTSGKNITRSLSSGEEDYGEHSYYQDAQDPNEDDDSGMSFDSIALHNLDT